MLHGAMAADGCDDCEGDLITQVRRIVGLEVVIGVELDLHCHFSEAMRSRSIFTRPSPASTSACSMSVCPAR